MHAGQEGRTLRCFSLARSAGHVWGPKGTHVPPSTSSAITSFPFLQKNHPGQAGCSPAEARLRGLRERSGSCSRAAASLTRQSCTCLPKGARTPPSLLLRTRGPFSFVLLQLRTPSPPPPTTRRGPSLHSVTPLLSCCLYPSATAVLLADAHERTHALAGCCTSTCWRGVSLAVCRQLPRNAGLNRRKPGFHSTGTCSCHPHPCRERKVHMRVGYVSVQV